MRMLPFEQFASTPIKTSFDASEGHQEPIEFGQTDLSNVGGNLNVSSRICLRRRSCMGTRYHLSETCS